MRHIILGVIPAVLVLIMVGGGGVRAESPAPSPSPLAVPLSPMAARAKAVEQIVASSQSADAFLRANAIEAAESLSDRVVPLVQLGLIDKEPVVRFTALAMIGKLKLKSLAPAAARLKDDASDSVRAAALYAQRACDQPADVSPMSAMLASPDPGVRRNVAMLLGLMGDKSAVPMLKEMAKVPMPRAGGAQSAITRLQIAEAVVRLGDEASLAAVRASAFSQFDEVRILALQMMGRLGDRVMEKAMYGVLKDNPVEVELAAAEALGRLGHNDGLNVALAAADSPLATVRAQAAATLGCLNSPRAADARARLLQDGVEQVRLSAAAAVLQSMRTGPLLEK